LQVDVSVIIPTYNAEKYLPQLLESLQSQSIDFELLIIDSSSTDKTGEIAKQYTDNVMLIPQKEFDHGGTRTKAARLAQGDVLVFLTQDALPYDRFCLENIVKAFRSEKIGAAYGKQVPYKETNLFGKHLREFNYTDKSYFRDASDIKEHGIKTAFLSDSFAAYRKASLEAIGWFKDGLIVGEDSYAGAKMIIQGFSIAYVSEAKVYHSHSYTVFQELKRYFDIGVFHKQESWILKEFSAAEGEGLRYVKSEFSYLLKHKVYYLIPQFFVRNLGKYCAYKLGMMYEKLPLLIIKKLSMHKSWWK